MVFNDYFSFSEPGIFKPIRRMLMDEGDKYMHLADLRSYDDAHKKALTTYKNTDEWNKKAIINIASSGKFSSDRTIAEYAKDIWNLKPCPIN